MEILFRAKGTGCWLVSTRFYQFEQNLHIQDQYLESLCSGFSSPCAGLKLLSFRCF